MPGTSGGATPFSELLGRGGASVVDRGDEILQRKPMVLLKGLRKLLRRAIVYLDSYYFS